MNDLMLKDEVDTHSIALAIARNALGMQYPAAELIQHLGIDTPTFIALTRNAQFKRMVKAYRLELERDNEGIRLKSAIALEDSIPVLHRIIHDRETPPNVVVQGCKQLADQAGINKQEEKAVGAGFQINIDLSGLSAARVTAQTNLKEVIEHDTGGDG